MNKELIIAMYHYVRDMNRSGLPKMRGLDISDFRKQLDFFEENFEVVRMEQVMDHLEGLSVLPENALLLTFDDGYRDHYDYVLPLLKEHGMQGSFFVPGRVLRERRMLDANSIHLLLATASEDVLFDDLLVLIEDKRADRDLPHMDMLMDEFLIANRWDGPKTNFIKRILQWVLPSDVRKEIIDEFLRRYLDADERSLADDMYMTFDELAEMRDEGMYIGVHGYSHDWMGKMPADEAISEIDASLEILDDLLDRNRWVMNYPYGNIAPEIFDALKARGCVMGITTEPRTANVGGEDPLTLPRWDCNDFPPVSERYLEG